MDDSGIAWDSGDHRGNNGGRALTRQTLTPHIPLKMPKSTKYKLSCAYSGPKMWLELSLPMRQIADRDEFKLKLKLKAREELAQLQDVYR